MRLTIEIPEDLLERVKTLAQRERTTVEDLTERGLRRLVGERGNGAPVPVKIKPLVVQGQGLTPEAQQMTWQQIIDEANERPHDWR